MATKEQERIVALQKQVKIAREALMHLSHYDVKAESALDEMNRIEWASKPNLVQEPVRR